MIGAAVLLAGCAGAVPTSVDGGWGAPSFAALQQMCGQTADYGQDTQAVYSAVFDAWVAQRHGKLPQAQFCGFQAALAQQYATNGKSGDMAARNQWVEFLNQQRANALSWRAFADSTLRAG
ncbi:hypothetical protein FAZ98_11415 [Paraburkholderia acidisoli]|uniref:Uncharacterized protein n=2 Tax=Paraburkholderia acidisoli TaxID=2571748 RepID=A0A7Z2GJI1_9BURK|nr:hypothetical protein FAZ98_11415 [Paraburkholderia acidisoli]